MNRQFQNNYSYADGRAVEIFIDKWFQKNGFTTISTRGSKNSYDLKIIDPQNFEQGEYLLQIKSSKTLEPYITCKHLNWLIEDAKRLKCIPLICFCYTSNNKFWIFDPRNKQLYFTNSNQKNKKIDNFHCFNKQK